MKNYLPGDILFKRILQQSTKYNNEIIYYDFIDPAQQKIITDKLLNYPEIQYHFFGGHNSCERKVICTYPMGKEEWIDWPISVVSLETVAVVEHRIVLGSLMALGITRETLGDIIINDHRIQIIAKEHITPYIINNLTRINQENIIPKISSLNDLTPPINRFREETIVLNSFRLDSVISGSYNLSRGNATEIIKKGLVRINHLTKIKPSISVEIGDLISVKGKGRFIFHEIKGNTRKDKIRVQIKKYL